MGIDSVVTKNLCYVSSTVSPKRCWNSSLEMGESGEFHEDGNQDVLPVQEGKKQALGPDVARVTFQSSTQG